MKQLFWGLVFSAVPAVAGAANGYLQFGGANSGQYATRSLGMGVLTANPAAGQFLLKKDQSFRMGILSLPNFGFEVGPVDNFQDDIEALQDELDRENLTQAEAEAIIDQFNVLLVEIGDAAYLNVDVQQQVPFTPMVFRAFGGVMTVDAGVDARLGLQILDSPLVLVDNMDGTFDAKTDSLAYTRSGIFTHLGLGYSRTLPAFEKLPLPAGSSLIAGGRVNVINGKLSKLVGKLDSGEEESAFENAEENYDANEVSKTSLGLDAGALFTIGNITAGATIYNLLAPKFEFGDVGVNCASIADPGLQADCAAVAQAVADHPEFAGQIGLRESYKEKTRLNVEAGYRILGSNWVVGGALDLNEVPSLAGGDFQWMHLSAGYESPNWWLPGFSAGYKKNLAGSKLSYATFGFSLLSFLNLNVSYGLDSVDVDGDSQPRSAAVGIAFEAPL